MYIQKAHKYCVRNYNYKVSVNTQLEQESCKLLVQKHLVRVNNVYTYTCKTQKHSSLQYSNIKMETRHAKKMITNKRTRDQCE